jgi:acetyltransferase-like isoleucine patch superfamily enzyme
MVFRVHLLKLAGYQIGKDCTIGRNFTISDRAKDTQNVIIGDRVNIASNVTLITTSAPNTSVLKRIYPIKYGKIIIENDCWIGTGVIILPGVKIGRCSIIGAGVVVDKDVPEFSAIKQKNIEIIKFPKSLIDILLKQNSD